MSVKPSRSIHSSIVSSEKRPTPIFFVQRSKSKYTRRIGSSGLTDLIRCLILSVIAGTTFTSGLSLSYTSSFLLLITKIITVIITATTINPITIISSGRFSIRLSCSFILIKLSTVSSSPSSVLSSSEISGVTKSKFSIHKKSGFIKKKIPFKTPISASFNSPVIPLNRTATTPPPIIRTKPTGIIVFR